MLVPSHFEGLYIFKLTRASTYLQFVIFNIIILEQDPYAPLTFCSNLIFFALNTALTSPP